MNRQSSDEQRRGLEAQCAGIARLLRKSLPLGVGFFLSVFDFGDGGWSTYMSNGQRADMVKFLRELADRLDVRAPYNTKNAGGSSEPTGGAR